MYKNIRLVAILLMGMVLLSTVGCDKIVVPVMEPDPEQIPPAPTELKALPVSSSGIRLEWIDNSSDEIGFRIQRCTVNSPWTLINTIEADTQSYTDSALLVNQMYSYRVSAFTASTRSAFSGEASATPTLQPPSNLTYTLKSSSTVELSWDDNSPDEEGFHIRRWMVDGVNEKVFDVSANCNSFSDSGLVPQTTYSYNVEAFVADGNSECSNEVSVIPEVAVPSELTATVKEPSVIELTWTDNSNDEVGYKIERKLGNGEWLEHKYLSYDRTAYTETNITPYKIYHYRVQAFTLSGFSAYSNVASALPVIETPQNLTTEAIDHASIKLEWDTNGRGDDVMLIERKTTHEDSFREIASGGIDGSFVDVGIVLNTTYVYRVRAKHKEYYSQYSNQSKATPSYRAFQTFIGNSSVNSTVFSPDGMTVAGGYSDGTVKIWRLSDGSCINTLSGHSANISSIAISPNGRTLVSGSWDKTVRIWNVADGTCIGTLVGHTKEVSSVAFSPLGNLIASGDRDKIILLWDFPSGNCVDTLVGHLGSVRSLSFRRDGRFLASASSDKTLRLWSLEHNECWEAFTEHRASLNTVAFSPDCSTLVSGDVNTMIKQRDAFNKERGIDLLGHTAEVNCVVFNPSGSTIASCSSDHTIKVWRAKDGYCLATLQTASQYNSSVKSVAFCPDGWIIAAGMYSGDIVLWK